MGLRWILAARDVRLAVPIGASDRTSEVSPELTPSRKCWRIRRAKVLTTDVISRIMKWNSS